MTAKLAKEKDFHEDTFDSYPIEYYGELNSNRDLDDWNDCDDYYAAPTQSLLQKWLREKYNIEVLPYPIQFLKNGNEIESLKLTYHYKIIIKGITQHVNLNFESESYEEALEIGLQHGLRLI
jgi:hypothetical protein